MIQDNKGLFNEAVYDDNEVCNICNQEALLFIKDLLDDIKALRKEIVSLRVLANTLSGGKDRTYPYPFPYDGLPGMGNRITENSVMRRYDAFFGEYVPEC